MASNVLPGYTHPIARGLYAEPEMAALVERGLAEAGALARRLGVRLSFHPGPFCLLASRNPAAIENGLSELDYHAEIFDRMGYGGGWHPHGAHINIHVGAGDPGVDGFRATLSRAPASRATSSRWKTTRTSSASTPCCGSPTWSRWCSTCTTTGSRAAANTSSRTSPGSPGCGTPGGGCGRWPISACRARRSPPIAARTPCRTTRPCAPPAMRFGTSPPIPT